MSSEGMRVKEGREKGRPETFDFLGFTFYCGESRKGTFVVKAKTSGKKFRKKIKALKKWLRGRLNKPVRETMETLNRKLSGHYRYYGVTYNIPMLIKYHYYATNLLYRMMNRRSQKRSYNWEGFREMLKYYPLTYPKRYINLYE